MMLYMGRRAREAARELALASTDAKNAALEAMAARIEAAAAKILEANRQDLEAAQRQGPRWRLSRPVGADEVRVEAMARGLREVAALADPVGQVMARWTRPNGLEISRVRVPIGVIGIIYKSRPNVTADAAGAVPEIRQCRDPAQRLRQLPHLARHRQCSERGRGRRGLARGAIQLVPTVDRAAVGLMLDGLDGAIDVIVPRGGKDLVARVQEEARVPVFAHLEGICHVYVHAGGRSRHGRRSCSTPRCGAPGFAGRPKRFWSIAPRRRRSLRRSSRR